MFTQRGLQIWLIVLSGICHHLWCKLLPFAGYIWACLLLESLKSPNHWWVEGVWLSLCCSNNWISVFLLVAHFFLQSAWWFVLFLWPFPSWLLQFYSLISLFSLWKQAGNLSEISFLRISVWKKTCCVFIKTRRWIIHHTSPPSGPFSSISWTKRDRKT